jgi:hypothetical protein
VITAFKVPLVDTTLIRGPRSTDAVRKLTESSLPPRMKNNQTAATADTAAKKMMTLRREAITSVVLTLASCRAYGWHPALILRPLPGAHPSKASGALGKPI